MRTIKDEVNDKVNDIKVLLEDIEYLLEEEPDELSKVKKYLIEYLQ